MHVARHRSDPSPAARAATALARLVWPVDCPGCGLPDVPVCRSCLADLAGPAFLTAPLTAPGAPVTWAAAPYADAVRGLVLAWKERGRHDLGAALATGLHRSLAAALADRPPAGPVTLVPAPSTRAAVRARGDDLVADLARRCATSLRRSGVPVRVEPVLALRPGAGEQVGRGARARRAGRAGALRLRALPSAPCVLVDDVVTTGATLAEARRLLEEAGVRVLAAATVAATPHPPGRPHRPG